jgi:DNA-binding CsgD family transcriptional regulator
VRPAPAVFAQSVRRRLQTCSDRARSLVAATSILVILDEEVPLSVVAVLAGVGEPLVVVEEACGAGLLRLRDEPGIREVMFPHPLVQAAVYEQVGPARRAQLHVVAAGLVADEGSALRHRVAAVTPPDAGLAGELEEFAAREAAVGAWAGAASALVEASRLSPAREERERRLLLAVDAMAGAGDLVQANAFARETVGFAAGPLRNAALGYLAVLGGRAREAEGLLGSAWSQCDSADDRASDQALAAVIGQRWALHAVGRLRGAEVVRWAGRAIELAEPGVPARVEADALLGLGLGWLGRVADGVAAYESVLDRMAGESDAAPVQRVKMAHGWLLLVSDDLAGARATLAETAPAARRLGSIRIAVWAYVWLSRADFLLGNWDDAAVHAERAVSLLEDSGHEWLRPLARWMAVSVPAARGEWAAAEEHARMAWAQSGDYELMIAAAGLARAELAAARGNHDGVLRALEPLLEITPRDGIDEPGFWPWQALYGDALVSAGRLEQAEAFLAPHERLATQRDRRSMVARLAGVRGRLEAAHGNTHAAEQAFQRGLELTQHLPSPFQRALLELAYGQTLRRAGQRRAAAAHLHAAHERLTTLGARPYLERCERELNACGLSPAKRHHFDPSKLTAQELAVARLVAAGMSNRQVAAELFISIKTVQYHLTHIYAKLGIRSRAELAANLRDQPAGLAGGLGDGIL